MLNFTVTTQFKMIFAQQKSILLCTFVEKKLVNWEKF